MSGRQTRRGGPNANPGATLPALQASRIADPHLRQQIEALREYIEVRLGSRGDPFEKAVTLREFDKRLAGIVEKLNEMGSFNGSLGSLRVESLEAFPPLKVGFEQVGENLYYCNGTSWFQVGLTPVP